MTPEERRGRRGPHRIGSPCAGEIVGAWRISSPWPGVSSRRKRSRIARAMIAISAWPKRIPMQVREPPPNGT